ncbi:MAG: N-acetyltransferase [Gammaproteobacteria bacterium]|nr:N-acetyltransferase [Gammaproteobacteria bacterium]
MTLRPEDPAGADATAIRTLNEAAFPGPEEAALVDALREAATPLISLVAEEDGRIVGHILFSPVTVDGHVGGLWMGLAPMAVSADRQHCGIGSALIRAGLEACRELGAEVVVVLGHLKYYPRFGFLPASGYGVQSEYPDAGDAFMALELRPGALAQCSGAVVRYHPAFAGL